jgi:EmrB/QacA subfamily drug resistance transporter
MASETNSGGWVGKSQAALMPLPGGRVLNPWLALIALLFGFFMSLLDATIVNIALTDIETSLKTDLTTVSWVLNAYNLVFAVLLVTMGRFADQFGRKRLFMLGMVLFSVGSLLCAVSPSIGFLIASRAIQGIGAAALNPVSLAIITVIFPPQKRGAAFGIWGALAGLASAVGPVLGGFLVQTFDWRAIFYVNLPFCIVGLYMVYLFVPESKDPEASRRIDLGGLITLTAGMFCLVLAIIQGNDWGWTSAGTLGLLAGGVVGLVLFLVIETRIAQPILDFSLFKFRSFTMVNITMFMFSVAVTGVFLLLVLYFINARNMSELDAAYALLPLPIASFFVSGLSGRFSNKVNPRWQGIAGMVFLTIGFLLLATLDAQSSYFDVAWRSVILGVAVGLCFTSFPTMVLGEIPHSKVGVGSGTFNTARQIGFALGVAILISLFTGQIKDNIPVATASAIQIVNSDTQLPAQVKSGITGALQAASAQASDSNSRNNSQFDLTTLANQIPNGQALKPELARLQGQIGEQFTIATVKSFTFTWLVSAIVAFIGLITAFFVRTPSRAASSAHWENQSSQDKPTVVDAV